MPNWCYTDITIYHDDKDKLKAFFDKVEEWRKKPYKENGFDAYSLGWLGNIVGNSGLAVWKINENGYGDFNPPIECRGSLQTFELLENQIHISTETAWSPMLFMWRLLCEKYLPEADITFTAEESGNGLFQTNDPDVIGKYYVDVYDPPEEFEDVDMEYEASEEYVIKLLQRILKTDNNNIVQLLNEADDLDWIWVHQWEDCDIDVY